MSGHDQPFELPAVGLGTWQMRGETAERGVRDAIELGYRLIDTAAAYHNEEAVGAGIRGSGTDPGELLVVTKFPEEDAGREREVLRTSLGLLGVDKIDLWLVHAPLDAAGSLRIWEQFIKARDEGLVRAIGVSNFLPEQVDELIKASGVVPAVNQIAFGPRYYDADVAPHHAAHGIALQAHSPFSENDLAHPVLRGIADRHGCTVRQVLLRWHRAHGVPVVVKSVSPTHLTENLDAAGHPLEPEDVAAIDRLGINPTRGQPA
ncbi:aldo/keto reductase [Streptomyces lancefieldiae]|uniref:Aldo/keto reductase n=1 Tax=Streptomyces lancefieldiae TaxID=3075520 RepID=A0ABU3AJ85_9ACTN|nr:aldo/keto reductase [Streptomyces sp. DSM 40712]MDT0610234.1 aldo/keto reductase [Streptomyces sp. DSM 40712]